LGSLPPRLSLSNCATVVGRTGLSRGLPFPFRRACSFGGGLVAKGGKRVQLPNLLSNSSSPSLRGIVRVLLVRGWKKALYLLC
jgi:hypothetical protein